jgi:hypothetical protein
MTLLFLCVLENEGGGDGFEGGHDWCLLLRAGSHRDLGCERYAQCVCAAVVFMLYLYLYLCFGSCVLCFFLLVLTFEVHVFMVHVFILLCNCR